MRMVRLQIGQEKVKESVEVERQKLQELAEEVSEDCTNCSSVAEPHGLAEAMLFLMSRNGLLTRTPCIPA